MSEVRWLASLLVTCLRRSVRGRDANYWSSDVSCLCVLVLVSMAISTPDDLPQGPIDELPSLSPTAISLAGAKYRFNPMDESINAANESASPSASISDAASRPESRPFGLADTRSWLVSGGIASNFAETTAGRAGLGVSYFVADDVSFDVELNVLYFDQPSHDAAAFNLNFLIRWHAWHDAARTWSIYIDGGAGIMVSDEDVPDLGSRFNFTPQFGAGMSFNVGGDSRLYLGVRWHHISNANVFEQNPGRDTSLFYAMLGFPF